MLTQIVAVITVLSCSSQAWDVRVPPDLFVWYFRSLNIRNVRYSLCQNSDYMTELLLEMSRSGMLTGFQIDGQADPPWHRVGGVIDVRCARGQRVLEQVSRAKLLNAHSEWLILESQGPTANIMPDIYALPSSYVTLAKVNSSHLELRELYRITTSTQILLPLLGVWPLQDVKPPLPARGPRTDFMGEMLRTSAVLLFPTDYQGFIELRDPELDIFTKITYPIAKTLEEQLNFSSALVIKYDYGWKDPQKGQLGLLLNEEIDFGTSGMFITEKRMEVIDYTAPLYNLENEIIFKQPPLPSATNIFLLTFSGSVWLCCLGISIMAVLVLRLDSATTAFGRSSFEHPLTLGEAVIAVIGTITEQGMSNLPTCLSSKTTMFTFSMAAIFFLTSYSANIVSLLQATSNSIKTINDLTNSRLLVKVQDVAYTKPMYEATKDNDVNNLYRNKIFPQGSTAYISPSDGIKAVRSGKCAYKVETVWGFRLISETFEEKEKCALRTLKDFVLPPIGLPVVKRSGYRELITQKVAWQRDVGLLNRHKKLWIPVIPTCASGSGRDYVRVDLIASRAPFILILSAAVASLLILAGERTYHYVVNSRLKCFSFVTQ